MKASRLYIMLFLTVVCTALASGAVVAYLFLSESIPTPGIRVNYQLIATVYDSPSSGPRKVGLSERYDNMGACLEAARERMTAGSYVGINNIEYECVLASAP